MSHVVLVVEDEEAIRGLIKAALEKAGYEVIVAGTGADMFTAFGSAEINLILLDLGLPDGDALPHVMQLREHSDVPIIIFTNRSKIDDRLMGLGLGADDYLTKPIDFRELILRVGNVLARSIGETKPPSKATLTEPSSYSPQKVTNSYGTGLLLGVILVIMVAFAGGYWGVFPMLQKHKEPLAIVNPSSEVSAQQTIASESPVSVPQTIVPTSKQTVATSADERVSQSIPDESIALSGNFDSKENPPLTKAEILGYDWILKTKCKPIPDVKWWKYRSHDDVASHILRRYDGEWKPFEDVLVTRLAKLYDIADRKSGAVLPDGSIIRGTQLSEYIEQSAQRLEVVRCLAAEAKAAKRTE